MPDSSRFRSLIRLSTTIREALPLMGSTEGSKFMAGIAVIVDEREKVIGVVTDGDIRRGLTRGVSIDTPVEAIANLQPLLLRRTRTRRQLRQDLLEESRRRDLHYVVFTRLILIEDDGRFHDVIQLSQILEPQIEDRAIAVYGQGFVGLTLACALAAAEMSVVGIDRNPSLIAALQKSKPPFYEQGLESLLEMLATHNPIRFTTDPHANPVDIHIVSVGSPIAPDKTPDLAAVKAIAATVAGVLKKGDLVVLRSTLPAGTTRNVIRPILETSGLLAGRDFSLAFAPERTVEGMALAELRTLPQIVGGIDKASTDLTAKLFSRVANSIVEVDSLEEAELIKLANNTFRDLVFAFANELAGICDGYNINAFRLIEAANEGYPRNPIPMPSPGVGGSCLSKDPYLYTYSAGSGAQPTFGAASRRINDIGPARVRAKLEAFARDTGRLLEDMRVLIVGLAFKGRPETSDTRDSMALKLVDLLPNRANVRIKDFIVSETDIRSMHLEPIADLAAAIADVDAVLFMNNHYMNNRFNLAQALRNRRRPLFFFDGWDMFDQREVEKLPEVTYATLGYATRRP